MPIRKTSQKDEDPERTKRIEEAKAKEEQRRLRQQQEDKEKTARIEAAKAAKAKEEADKGRAT